MMLTRGLRRPRVGARADSGDPIVSNTSGINDSTEVVMKKMVEATIDVEDDMDMSLPEARDYCNYIEQYCDVVLVANKFSKEPSLGIPQLAMIVQCPDHFDKVNGDLNSGYFYIL